MIKRGVLSLYKQMLAEGLDDVQMLERTGWTRAALVAIKAEVREDQKRREALVADAKAIAKPSKPCDARRPVFEEAEAIQQLRAKERENRERQKALREAKEVVATWAPGTVVGFRKRWEGGTALDDLAEFAEAREKDLPFLAASLGLPARESL